MSNYSRPFSFTEYQLEARRTQAGEPDLIIAALGLCGEAGEFADHLKKHFAQGHDLDRDALVEELGDILWYAALASDALGWSMEDIAETNLAKLAMRFPNGFSPEASVHRPA